MKARILLPFLTAAVAVYGVQQEAQESALKAEIQALETRVATIESYLQARATSAQSIATAIDRAVEKGYTAGINFEARQVLVDAWKADIQAGAAGVPGAPKPAPTDRTDPRVLRRQTGGR